MQNKFLLIFTLTLCAHNSYSSQQKPETPEKKGHDRQEKSWGQDYAALYHIRTELQPTWDEQLEKAEREERKALQLYRESIGAQPKELPHPLTWWYPTRLLPKLVQTAKGHKLKFSKNTKTHTKRKNAS